MSGRRRKGLSPSLFPFLAVLVCTLGTLILLLALVAQNATQAAEQQTEADRVAKENAEQAPPTRPRLKSATVASLIDEERFRVEQLVTFRDQQTADVEARRDELTHLEDHIQRVRQRLQRLSDEVDRATGEAPLNAIDESAIIDVRQQLAEEKAAVEQLREQQKSQTPRVVIVPHKGPNGTDRRPVYLECTASGVKIWPEGSEITMLQLEDSEQTANPLDAALRVIRHHWMKTYGDTVPPYPLIVVRPDGIESYAAVRQAMRDWDDQFGYELVPADVELAFTRPDPTLKQRVDLAIRQAIIQQHARHAIARRSTGRKRVPTLSVAQMDRARRASGYKSYRDDMPTGSAYTGGYGSGGYGSRDVGSGRYGAGSSYMSSSEYPGSGSGSEATRRLDEHLRAAAADLDRDGSSAASDSTFGSAAAASPDRLGASDQAIGGDDAAATMLGQSSLEAPSNSEASGTGSGARTNPHFKNTGSPGPNRDDSSASSFAESSDPGGADQQQSASSTAAGDPSQSGQKPGGNARVDTSHSQPGGTSQAQAASASAGAGPSASADSQTKSQGNPSPQISVSPPSRDLVQRQGRDWALPGSVAQSRGNAIVRSLRVQCYSDRFLLLPPAGKGVVETFRFSDGEVGRATMELATAVRDRVDRWGPAIPGGRWQPRLEVEVMSRADTRFHQLRTLMSGSGVDVKRRAR